MSDIDSEQVEQALRGDAEAFRVLVERHSRRVFAVAYRITSNEADADEVVQDTFLKAYRRLDQFNRDASFGTWVYRIAVNCSMDLMRRRKRRKDRRGGADPRDPEAYTTFSSGDPDPARLAFSEQVRRRVGAALDELSEQERTAFALRHFEGRSIREIGDLMGLRTSATKNAIFRGVQKMRAALQPLIEGGEERPAPRAAAEPEGHGDEPAGRSDGTSRMKP